MSNLDPEKSSAEPSRRKDAIIAAIATVLAAVIVASATIIVGGKREKATLENNVATLHVQLETKTTEAKTLEATVADLQKKVSQLEAAAHSTGQVDPQATSPGTGAVPSAPPQPPPPVSRSVDTGDITIGFQRCIRRGNNIVCDFMASNNGGECEVTINGGNWLNNDSRAMDDQGKQQLADAAAIAGVEGSHAHVELPSKISVPAQVTFFGVSTDVKEFKVLDIGFYARRDHRATFRDVPIAE